MKTQLPPHAPIRARAAALSALLILSIPLSRANTIHVASGTVTESGTITGATGLTKTGAGTLILDGANKDYTGGTFINEGAIQIAAIGTNIIGSGTNAPITLNGGALHADFSSSLTPGYVITVGASGGEIRLVNAGTSGRWLTTTDKIAGSGTLTLSFGGGNARYQLNAAQSGFTGKWVLQSGGNFNKYFDMDSSSGFGNASGDDAITMNRAGILLRNNIALGSGTQGITLTGDGISRIDVANGAAATVAGKISGTSANTLELNSGNEFSVLTLSNTGNSWAGNTVIRTTGTAGGIVRLGAAGVLPDAGGNVTINSGMILDLNSHNETIGGLDGAGIVRSSSGPATLSVGANNNSPTFTGVLENGGGTLSLTKVGNGIQSLSGTNTYSGKTLVSTGTLKINASGSIANTPEIRIAAGATFDVTAVAGGFLVGASQALVGNGAVNGNIRIAGDLGPGNSPGLLSFNNNLTLESTATTTMELGGFTRESQYDAINVTGILTYGGDLEIVSWNGWDLNQAGSYNLFDSGSVSGNFSSVSLGAVSLSSSGNLWTGNNGAGVSYSFDISNGELTVIPEPSSLMLVGVFALAALFRNCRKKG